MEHMIRMHRIMHTISRMPIITMHRQIHIIQIIIRRRHSRRHRRRTIITIVRYPEMYLTRYSLKKVKRRLQH